jgi:hypothetical protein
MIWGKTTKARLVALLKAWTMMVFQLIRWVDLRRSLSTWRILKNMILLLLQTDRFLHLQATPLKAVVRLHTHTECQQLARNQGWTVISLHKKKNV